MKKTHGMSKTPEYNVWNLIKERCKNVEDKRYGGRGISICKEWDESFEKFFAHVGHRPSSTHQIDRINNDGNYEYGNVRWATRKEQAANRISNILISYNGETKILKEWAESLGMPYGVLLSRVNNGWEVEKAFTAPINKLNNHGNKIILNMETGIFYDGAKEALFSTHLKSSVEYFRRCLQGYRANKTAMTYV